MHGQSPGALRSLSVRIAVIEFAGFGGMAHYAFQLCRGLSSAGADVTLITRDDYELVMLAAPFAIEQTIGSIRRRSPRGTLRRVHNRIKSFREWRRLIRRIEALRPDAVLLGQLSSANDYWPLLQLRRKVKVLANVCHHVRVAEGFLWKRIYRLFDHVFVHSARNRAALGESLDIPEERAQVIAHGNEEIFSDLADPTFSAASLRSQLGIGSEERVVLFFGNLAHYKGLDVLLRAFPRVSESTDARLVIAGHPTPGFDLQEHILLAESLGIADATVWVPEYIPSEHVVAWMQLASVIVFPYREVSHAGALHIAQTYGVPTVASSVSAMQDVIDDGVSGVLVAPEDVDALSHAITRVIEDREFAQRIGAQFASDARGRFSWEAIGAAIVERLRG